MKVKEEDLKRELLKAMNGEDLIKNCAERLGIGLNRFKERLYRARIHGVEAVLHSNRPCGYSDSFKLEVVHSVMQGMPKETAATKFNMAANVISSWLKKYVEGGEDALLEDNRGRPTKMGRKPKPKLSD